jgi:hypothetical protein
LLVLICQNLKQIKTSLYAVFKLTANVEAITSKGLLSDALSTDTELDASYND